MSSIVITKTCPTAPSQAFTFRPGWKASFTMMDGGSNTSSGLSTGQYYAVSEDPLIGFLSTVVVSSGDPLNKIFLPPSTTITVAFTNAVGTAAPPGGTSFTAAPAPTSGPFQIVPLDSAANQVWQVTVTVNGQPVTLNVQLRYNEIAKYWVMTISDGQGNLLLDSLPFVTGVSPSGNILAQFGYLGIGSAVVYNASNVPLDHPNSTELGTDFVLLWGNNPL